MGLFQSGEEMKVQDEVVKITITREAAEALGEVVSRVSEGFECGRITRQGVASWILIRFKKTCVEGDVSQIRQSHYDDASMLDSVLRQIKESGEMPEYLRNALRKQFGAASESLPRAKKTLTDRGIFDGHRKSEEAV